LADDEVVYQIVAGVLYLFDDVFGLGSWLVRVVLVAVSTVVGSYGRSTNINLLDYLIAASFIIFNILRRGNFLHIHEDANVALRLPFLLYHQIAISLFFDDVLVLWVQVLSVYV